MAKPKLIVFDLDYTLWPFWVDTHVIAPFKLESGKIYDAHGQHVKSYPDSTKILQELHSEGYKLALASRTSYTREAKDLVRLFGWDRYVTYSEIYPGSKIAHFNKFHAQSRIPYNQMLFFDDEQRNITDLSQIGVVCILPHDGVSKEIIKQGLRTFAAKNSNT
ncbi:Magnesium-dependent phosphatase 1 [Lamellibrachia satsuma]|nr:Magnesium-dependent phosphatase 1 [Lamellibrachia satsuma]